MAVAAQDSTEPDIARLEVPLSSDEENLLRKFFALCRAPERVELKLGARVILL